MSRSHFITDAHGMNRCVVCGKQSHVTELELCCQCDKFMCYGCSVAAGNSGMRMCKHCKSEEYYIKANELYEDNDIHGAIIYYTKASELGHKIAMNMLEKLMKR